MVGAPGQRPSLVRLGRTPGVSLSLLQFQIRALESQKRQQEIVLRRKTQEVRLFASPWLCVCPSVGILELRDTPRSRQCQLGERISQKGGRIFMAQ